MRKLLPISRLGLFAALFPVAFLGCRKAPEVSSAPAALTSPQDTAAARPPAPTDTTALDLRPATSAEVLAFVKDGRAPLTIVNFWATWCAPCVVEFPALVRAGEDLEAEGVRLAFVSVDDLQTRADVMTFLARQGVRDVTFQKNEADEAFIGAFSDSWSGTLPATFVYDRSGRVVAYFDRPVTFASITDTARVLLRTTSL